MKKARFLGQCGFFWSVATVKQRGLMHQWFQHFNHANLTIRGGVTDAGRPQWPLCGSVRRLRESQREIPDNERGSGPWGACGARRQTLKKLWDRC